MKKIRFTARFTPTRMATCLARTRSKRHSQAVHTADNASKVKAITRRQKQVGQTEIDGEADQQPNQGYQKEPMPRPSHEKRRRQQPRSRADHHGWRHRVTRLARVDHQVKRRKAEHRGQRERCRLACRSEEHTSELQSRFDLVCRLLLEKK